MHLHRYKVPKDLLGLKDPKVFKVPLVQQVPQDRRERLVRLDRKERRATPEPQEQPGRQEPQVLQVHKAQ